MPRRSVTVRVAATLAALALGAGLAACADTTRIPPAPTDTGAAEPLFASDEEALAAAVAAYEEYAAVVDALLARDAPTTQLREVAEIKIAESTEAEIEEFLGGGYTATAPREISASQLQGRISEEDGSELVVLYVCEDLTNVDVVDEAGESVVGERTNPRTEIEVVIRVKPDFEGVVTEREVWNGSGICA
ncbi:hypothetical protein [Microcella alkaliphila]|uniref:Lipoprotein n=1 Tax=Microcella alkaliphila TaxID=279828 RepID=A0A0U4WVN1_9MICO|nr:hypothetical protein [Microcella alkaliphila]BAU31882.1 uncharacterized protein MalAC0309_1020 [Microcella alkaliphila]